MSKILVVKNGEGNRRTQMIEELLLNAGHEVVYEMPKPEPLKIIVDEWNMVNGSTINFSEELEKLDSIMLYGGGRGGGMSYTLHNNYVMEDWNTKLLTQPEKKATITPSTLIVKLIGRI